MNKKPRDAGVFLRGGLDPAHALFDGLVDADITLDADSFTRLQPSVSRVFITENEINFLAFPRVEDSLLVFGVGYGFEVLVFEDQWGVEDALCKIQLDAVANALARLFIDWSVPDQRQ